MSPSLSLSLSPSLSLSLPPSLSLSHACFDPLIFILFLSQRRSLGRRGATASLRLFSKPYEAIVLRNLDVLRVDQASARGSRLVMYGGEARYFSATIAYRGTTPLMPGVHVPRAYPCCVGRCDHARQAGSACLACFDGF
eukprot:scaffold1616_cov310-Pinguiococcus_pyrenoidosus.AAC.37